MKKNDALAMTPTQLVAKMIDETPDSNAAAEAMLAWMDAHPNWEKVHLPAMRTAWVNLQIGAMLSNHRRELMERTAREQQRSLALERLDKVVGESPIVTATKPVVDFAAALRENYRRMIDMPLWGGKRLGDATMAEIAESARRFHLSSKTMERQARFHAAVAAEMERLDVDPDWRAADVLSADAIDQIWEKTDAA